MDNYNVLVMMEKDNESGYLSNTIDSYTIESGIELVESIYLLSEEDDDNIYLILTTEDVEDWQYYGIYDLYDETVFDTLSVEILDGSGEYNPRWIIKIPYNKEREEIEKKLNSIISLHSRELTRILPLVDLEKERYMSEIEE